MTLSHPCHKPWFADLLLPCQEKDSQVIDNELNKGVLRGAPGSDFINSLQQSEQKQGLFKSDATLAPVGDQWKADPSSGLRAGTGVDQLMPRQHHPTPVASAAAAAAAANMDSRASCPPTSKLKKAVASSVSSSSTSLLFASTASVAPLSTTGPPSQFGTSSFPEMNLTEVGENLSAVGSAAGKAAEMAVEGGRLEKLQFTVRGSPCSISYPDMNYSCTGEGSCSTNPCSLSGQPEHSLQTVSNRVSNNSGCSRGGEICHDGGDDNTGSDDNSSIMRISRSWTWTGRGGSKLRKGSLQQATSAIAIAHAAKPAMPEEDSAAAEAEAAAAAEAATKSCQAVSFPQRHSHILR